MKKFGITLLFIFTFLVVLPTQAALLNDTKKNEYNNNISNLVAMTEYSQATLEDNISTVIKIALSLLGTIFVVLMFLAGNDWMQAAGNEEKIKKSKQTILNLVIGLILVLAAYALSSALSGLLAKTLLTK
jgi:uncharacterized membrane protein YwzB